MEMEVEMEVEMVADKCVDQRYSRENEDPVPWPIELLGRPVDHPQSALMQEDIQVTYAKRDGAHAIERMLIGDSDEGGGTGADDGGKPFYSMRKFSVYQDAEETGGLTFPRELLLTSNFYKPKWGGIFGGRGSHRRLKNAFIVMEWRPPKGLGAEGEVVRTRIDDAQTRRRDEQLRSIFKMHDADGSGQLSHHEFQLLLRAIHRDVDVKMDDTGASPETPIRTRSASETMGMRGRRKTVTELLTACDTDGDGTISFEEVRTIVNDLGADDDGNYFVLLTLAEAAAVRAALHAAEWDQSASHVMHRVDVGLKLVEGLGLASNVAADPAAVGDSSTEEEQATEMVDDMWLLDATAGFGEKVEAQPSTQLRSRQCIRFVDSNTHFGERSIFTLVQQLVASSATADVAADEGKRSCKAREEWWSAVRRSRRRPPVSWQETPLKHIFTTADGLKIVERNTLQLRIAQGVHHHFGTLRDAFQYFDYDRSGSLSKEELYGGLKKLVGDTVRPDMVRQIVSHIDGDGNGEVSFEEFCEALGDDVAHVQSQVFQHGPLDQVELNKVLSPNQPARLEDEPSSPGGAGAGGGAFQPGGSDNGFASPTSQVPRLSDGQLRAISVEVSVVLNRSDSALVEKVWDTYGTGSMDSVSVWRLAAQRGNGRGFMNWGSSERFVSLGHFVSEGYEQPGSHARLPVLKLSVSKVWGDHASIDLAVGQLLRKPLGYRLVWKKLFGEKDFYAWQPKAPEGYVALGMVGTDSSKKPPKDAIRCVPISWLMDANSKLRPVWEDAGGTGGSVGGIWAAPAIRGAGSNSVGLLVVNASEARPTTHLRAFGQSRFDLATARNGALA
jgi:Ca2+-binding EF-hand superfamily protein